LKLLQLKILNTSAVTFCWHELVGQKQQWKWWSEYHVFI